MNYRSATTSKGNIGESFASQEQADARAAAMDASGCINCVGCIDCIDCVRCEWCRGCENCEQCVCCSGIRNTKGWVGRHRGNHVQQ